MPNITNFFYRYNEVSTFNQWNTPTWDIFNKWWLEFKKNVDLEDYNIYLGGSFMINPSISNDVDVMFTGPIYDYQKLYDKFKYGLDLSLNKYGIYVDLCWWDSVDFCSYPRKKDFFRYHNLIKMSGVEYKVINNVSVLDLFHKTFDSDLEVPDYLSFNRVILPMEKQRLPQYQYKPMKLH